MLRFYCTCGKRLKVEETCAGRVVQCPACGQKLRAPSPEPVPEAHDVTTLESLARDLAGRPASHESAIRRILVRKSKRPVLVGVALGLAILGAILILCWLGSGSGTSKEPSTGSTVHTTAPATHSPAAAGSRSAGSSGETVSRGPARDPTGEIAQ